MNKELEEVKDCLKGIIQNTYAEGKAIKLNYLLNYIDNSISKEVIEEKIEELIKKEKKELKGTKGQDRYFIKQMYAHKRKSLEELLEQK